MTEANILLAWRRTGLRPVDPSVITPEMLAPSKVFAPEETFPVPPSSPIHGVIAAFKQMHIDSTPPTVSPLLASSPLDFSNRIPSSPHDRHNTLDIFPSHHHPLPDALTSLNAGPGESPPLAPMDSVRSLAAGVAPSATSTANQIISTLHPLKHLSLWTTTPSPLQMCSPLLKPLLFLMFNHRNHSNDCSSFTGRVGAIKQSITGLHQSYQTVLAHNVLQDLHCKKLREALAAKEKSKGRKKNAQQLLGTNSGRILTGDAMISALLADEEARAAKESSKEAAKALRDLRASYNAWRTQATADKVEKHAQNLAEWELKCLALPPGARKPRKPTQPKRKDTPARFRDC
jgi:regulator of replication initiation timing